MSRQRGLRACGADTRAARRAPVCGTDGTQDWRRQTAIEASGQRDPVGGHDRSSCLRCGEKFR
jgi:hypothetical protein